MNAQRVEVLHAGHGEAVVVGITYALKLYLLPALQALFYQYLIRESESTLSQLLEGSLILADTATQAAQRISRTDHHRIAYLAGSFQSICHVLHSMTLWCLHRNLVQLVHEEVTILCIHDSLYRGTQHLHAILLQDTLLIEFSTAVQSRLSTECQQDAVWSFLLNDTLHEVRGDRQEIHLVCYTFRSLNGSDVRIHQHRADTFFTQGLESLRARVVELSSLSNLKRTRA